MYKLYESCDIVLSLMKSNEFKIARAHGNVKLDKDSDLSREFDANQGLRIIDIIEKPKPHQIMSDYYSLPLYLTSNKIMQFMKNLDISERGEKEFQEVLKNALVNNLDLRGIRIVSPSITINNIGKFHLTALRDIIKMNMRFLIGLNLSSYKGKKANYLEPLKLGTQNIIGDNITLGPYVITGCAHAGIINTVDYARRLTGIDRVYAVMGGFHLSGEPFQEALEPTLDALQKIDPKVIVPMHCTGIEAKSLLYGKIPDRIKVSGVGTTFHFPLS